MRGLAWSIVAVAAAYAVVLLVVWSSQERLLYLAPTHAPSELARLANATGTRLWPSANAYVGALREAPNARGTVVVFHGNAGSAFDRSYYADALAPGGLRVLLAEYPGYGAREGAPGEQRYAQDAVAILQQTRRDFGGPVYAIGESLGAGVLAAALHIDPDLIDAVLLVTPWDSLANVAADAYPWLPARRLLRDRYDTLHNLASFRRPIGILRVADDEIIRPAHTERLVAAMQPTVWTVPRGGHNGWLDALPAGFWSEVAGTLFRSAP